MDVPVLVDKPVGATPLEALGELRVCRPELSAAKLSYAGRLDPMASGLLVVLHGDLLAMQERFWHLPKVYDAEILLGISTDTFDLLGLAAQPTRRAVGLEEILTAAQSLVGRSVREVPLFSSIIHEGKPLFAHARAGSTPAKLPVRRMNVSEVTVGEVGELTPQQINSRVGQLLSAVRGDFRQEAIGERWHRALTEAGDGNWPLIRMRIACSAGTYVRTLAHQFGLQLGTGGVLAGLRRVSVGPWSVDDPSVVRLS